MMGMGMMGAPPGNAVLNQQAMMQAMMGAGMRQGLDMTNPIIIQMMMQQMQQVRDYEIYLIYDNYVGCDGI